MGLWAFDNDTFTFGCYIYLSHSINESKCGISNEAMFDTAVIFKALGMGSLVLNNSLNKSLFIFSLSDSL